MEGVKSYHFRIVGITPLLMHYDNIEWGDKLAARRAKGNEKGTKSSTAGDDRNPHDTWLGCLYHDGKHISFPTDNLRTMLTKAATRVIVKKSQTFKKILPSALIFRELDARFTVNGKQIAIADVNRIVLESERDKTIDASAFSLMADRITSLGFSLLVKRATVGASKHVRVRPKFPPEQWAIDGEFDITNPEISESRARQFFEIAGDSIGIGDWRPDAPKAPGPYGRFRLDELTAVSE